MQDDPFARAAQRLQEAEQADADAKRARRRQSVTAHSRAGFRIHASVYVAVNLLLVVIWATTTPGGYPWFLYPLLGWGIGLVANYAAVSSYLGRGSAPSAAAVASETAPAPLDITKPAAATTAAASTIDELERLTDLHAAGALSDDEFSAAKAKLLR